MATTTLLEQPTEIPASELPFARRFIAACRFTYAKTVPQAPHEYLVRRLLTPDLQADFDTLAALIGQHGYRGRFQGATFTYLNVVHEDGSSWRYWQSSAFFPPDPDGMLNRANNEAAPVQPLQPEQLDLDLARINKDGAAQETPANTALSQPDFWASPRPEAP